jgi:hypothetical protein
MPGNLMASITRHINYRFAYPIFSTDAIVEDAIMKSIFAQVTNYFSAIIGQLLGKIVPKSSTRQTLSKESFHGNSGSSGMFGILVSGEVGQGYLR